MQTLSPVNASWVELVFRHDVAIEEVPHSEPILGHAPYLFKCPSAMRGFEWCCRCCGHRFQVEFLGGLQLHAGRSHHAGGGATAQRR